MLAYLDALLAAVAGRDTAEIDRLLAHPLVRILSAEALADVAAERRAADTRTPTAAPIYLLQLRFRTAQLLSESGARDAEAGAVPAADPVGALDHRRLAPLTPAWSERRPAARHQMELPLSA